MTFIQSLTLSVTCDLHVFAVATQVQVLHAHGEVHLGDIPWKERG